MTTNLPGTSFVQKFFGKFGPVLLILIPGFLLLCFQADTSFGQDTLKSGSADRPATGLQIDTGLRQAIVPDVPPDTMKQVDSLIAEPEPEKGMTNTKLFIYILMSVLGLSLFFFIFVITLFKTFHKKRSTRQSLILSWSLFFVVSIIWLFIVWGVLAGFWSVASFMVVMIFLFIISLIMTIIALKTK